MLFAATSDTSYKLLLLIHILTALVAMAPAFVHPFLANQLDGEARNRAVGHMARNGRVIYAPALLVTGIAGFGVAGLSDGVFKMSQGWMVTAFIIWVVMNGILHAVMLPAERAMASGDRSAEARVQAGGAVLTVLLVVMLWLMVFKPGHPL